MKYLILLLPFFVSSCGACSRAFTSFTGGLTYKCSDSGVEYIQSDSGLALHVDENNEPIKCRNK